MIPATPPPLGFRFGAVEAAVKAPGRLDMGCILCDRPAAAAGVFTRNRVVAAPVTLCRERVPSAAVPARTTASALTTGTPNRSAVIPRSASISAWAAAVPPPWLPMAGTTCTVAPAEVRARTVI
ncbi:MAG: bifunctional ornithine acetyltransferase/N-acetylglutamate synthase, partial [Longimicrobiales bacterium]|nr:bifunctional ornithine acetyltransferase/N-acetylglutamate synthase [Longimicrobiales bacterium]